MSLVVGGRIFYEIDMIDNSGELIRFIHFHSALDVVKDFEVVSSGNTGTIILILVLIGVGLIISAILFYYYIKRRKEMNKSEIGGIEIHQFNLIKK
jgi:LPXTG-motif cell wall-anchored protein